MGSNICVIINSIFHQLYTDLLILFCFSASEYLPETKKKIEEQLQVIKRILRVECEMRRGQFEELVKVFDTNQKERLF